ncbi:serine/threonine-protein phosphatase 6 regulatory ankyrin repeat subunit C-like isoform X3 [Haliotis rufescens]|uniref:serine/threonine-protein phosphatase 6 regulatory ankyrin repeat subunit C-like isoform X3 n=1 Tax=Haliotis rufescens TaxID=6454 RepID=UPI00201F7BE8|nr:serine/threonine-protein phosphatase 6 regulatory ankyrin repeat subunit C-like isoform X3 [Haliotis rufescens]
MDADDSDWEFYDESADDSMDESDAPTQSPPDVLTQIPLDVPTQSPPDVQTQSPPDAPTQSPPNAPTQISPGDTEEDQPTLPKRARLTADVVIYSRVPRKTSLQRQTEKLLPPCESVQRATHSRVGSSLQSGSGSHGAGDVNQELLHAARDMLCDSTGRNPTLNLYNMDNNTGVTIKSVTRAMDPQLKNLIDQSHLRLRDLKEEPFVKTHFITQSEGFLHTRGMVVLTGRSGDGKTTAGLHLLKSFSEQESRSPVILTDPNQWDHIPVKQHERKVQQTFFVLIDDAFGKTNLVQDLENRWNQKFPMMIPVIEDGVVKLAITSRSHILSACVAKTTFLKKCPVVDFSVIEENHADERLAILEDHLKLSGTETCIDTIEKQRIVQSSDLMGFPQCCSVFSKDKSIHHQASTFFFKPLTYISENIESLSDGDPVGYTVLLLVFLKGGELHRRIFNPFDRSKEDSDLLEKFLSFSSCDIQQLERKAKSMCTTYLTFVENTDSYRFVHQSVMDVVSIQVCKTQLTTGLKFCTISVLLEYVRTTLTPESDHIILIPRNKFDILSERLTQELFTTNQELIITHPAFQDPELCQFLIHSFWNEEDKMKMLRFQNCTKKVFTKIFFTEQTVETLSALALGIAMVTENSVHVEDVLVLEFTSVLCLFTLSGCNLIVMELLATAENSVSEEDMTQTRQDVLATAVYKGNSALIEEMLQRKTCLSEACIIAACASETADNTAFDHILETSDAQIMNIFNWPLVAILLEKNKWETIEKLAYFMCKTDKGRGLLMQLCKCLLLQFHNVTPLLYLSTFGSIKKDSLLEMMPFLSSVGINCSTNEMVLLAVGYRERYPLSMIHGYGGNLACTTSRGDTPLHLAAHIGTAEMVEYLLQHHVDKSFENEEGWLPLHFAAQSDIASDAKLHLLFEPEHASTATLSGMTPLMLACKAGNILCVEYFRQKGYGNHGDHPIHAAILGVSEVCTKHNLGNLVFIQKWLNTIDILLDIGYSFSDKSKNVHSIELIIQLEREDIGRVFLERWPSLQDELNKSKGTPLHVAVKHAKHETVQYLIEKGANVNAEDNNQVTPLHVAVEHAKHETVLYLIEKGANVNAENNNQVTPLHVAVEHAKHETVHYLIEKGASVKSEDNNQVTPLHVAVAHAKHETVLYLIDKGANVNAEDINQVTPLHVAVEHAKHETVLYLIEKGANVNAEDINQVTPLHVAVEHAKHETVLYLIEKGANVNAENKNQVTPLHVAAEHAKHETVLYLIEKGASVKSEDNNQVTPLHVAVEHAKHETVHYLIEKGASVTARGRLGVTPLHVAVEHAKHETVLYLIEKGARVNASGRFGATPLHAAVKLAKHETAQYLIEKGANVNAEDKNQVTPLHVAVKLAKHETVQYLIEKGANVNAEDNTQVTPLHFAVEHAQHETVLYLIEKGANVNAEDKNQVTPLHFAVEHAQHETVLYLIEKGANVNAEDKNQVTPLHVAVKLTKHETAQYLIEKGANVNAEDKNQVTPLHVAVEHAKHETVQYLIQKRARVNAEDNNQVTPLHVAVKHAKHETVQYLIEKGASLTATGRFGVTPLHSAVELAKLETALYLIEKGARLTATGRCGVTPLHVAVVHAKHKTVQYLIEKGANVNAEDINQVTPLHFAVELAKHKTVQYLIEKGANVNAEDINQVTPLHFAVELAKHKTAQYLIEKGANVNAEDNNQVTPLHFAVEHAKHKTVQYLIEKGANVNAEDNNQVTPLHVAVKHAKHESVQYLIEKRARVNARGMFGVTPLHVAVAHAKHETVQYLIQKRARVNAEDNNQVTPLHVAVEHAKHETVQYLIEKGANVNAEDNNQVTPLHVTVEHAKHETVQYLIEKGASINAEDNN